MWLIQTQVRMLPMQLEGVQQLTLIPERMFLMESPGELSAHRAMHMK